MKHYLNPLIIYSGKKIFLFLAVTLGMLILYVPDSRAFDCSADSWITGSYVIDADLRSCGDNLGLPQNGIAFSRIDTSPGGSGGCGFTPFEFTAYVDGQTVSESSLTASLTNCGFIRDGKYLWLDGSTTVTFSFEVNGVVTSISLFMSQLNPFGGVFNTGAFSVSTGIFNNNADLTGLALSSGTLSPVFAASTTSYTASVANSVSSITVTPTASEANATVTVNGTAVTSGSASGSIALSVGSNTITTVVTAPDGTTQQTYTTEVTRAQSSDASLEYLGMNAYGSLGYSNAVTSYSLNVVYETDSMTFMPCPTDKNASVSINSDPYQYTSGQCPASEPVNFSVGLNVITIVVTSEDGSTQKTITINVTRAGSSDADMSGLSLSSGTLSPTFDASTTSYTASVANSVSSITVTPTASEANATITVNGTAVTSGSASGSIALSVGSNTITTVVTAQDGVGTSSYILTIHRADEDNLCDLSIPFDGCTMTPTGYKVLVYALGLCETAPTLPTTTSALDHSNCVFLYDKIGVDGVVVELAGVGYSTGLNADFKVPPKGTYRYAIVGLGQAISVKRQMEFPNPVKGRDGSVGRYCVTAHSDTYENWSTCSNSSFPEAGYSTDILYGFGTSEDQYSLGLDQNITAYAMTNDYRISTSQGATSWILGYQQFDAPLVIDESINSLDIAFTISKGMELYDADSGSDYEVAPAPGEFSFQISVR